MQRNQLEAEVDQLMRENARLKRTLWNLERTAVAEPTAPEITAVPQDNCTLDLRGCDLSEPLGCDTYY